MVFPFALSRILRPLPMVARNALDSNFRLRFAFIFQRPVPRVKRRADSGPSVRNARAVPRSRKSSDECLAEAKLGLKYSAKCKRRIAPALTSKKRANPRYPFATL